MGRRRPRGDRGSAVVEFTLVSALVTFLFLAVVQLAVVVHVRNTLVDCAGDGARFGALAGNGPQFAVQRTRQLVEADLSARYSQDVSAGYETVDGIATVVVRVRAPLPVAGLFGVGSTLSVAGHAVAERP
jgi:TadE-like protein